MVKICLDCLHLPLRHILGDFTKRFVHFIIPSFNLSADKRDRVAPSGTQFQPNLSQT